MFAHLHVHSTYSIFDGMAGIKALFEKAEALGQPGLALTDHGYLHGIPEFLAESRNHPSVKPVIGCEIYITDGYDHTVKDPDHRRTFHLILLAKNLKGYRNLVKICSESAIGGLNYGKPRISHEYLECHSEGLIAMSACIGGEIPQAILDEDIDGARDCIRWYRDVFGEDFYLEVSEHRSRKIGFPTDVAEMQRKSNEVIFALAAEYGVKVVATNDVHFVNREDAAAHDTLLCVNTGKKLKDPDRLSYSGEEYFKSEEEMAAVFPDHPEVISNTMDVLGKVERFDIGCHPDYPEPCLPEGCADADEALKNKAFWHLKNLGWENNGIYVERLERELAEIKERGVAGYFLLISDLCEAVRSRGGIVGPGRGTAASLLVNYLLGITVADPIKNGLLMERFFPIDRSATPAIDLDFNEAGLRIASEYLREKYGPQNVGRIVSFPMSSAAMAIEDSFKAHSLNRKTARMVNRIISDAGWNDGRFCSLASMMASPHSEISMWYASADEEQRRALEDAGRLQGRIIGRDIHCCSYIIARRSLDEYVPLSLVRDEESGENLVVSQYDGHYVEACGPVKLNLLSLRSLDIAGSAEDVNFDDNATLDIFRRGDTTGVFMFENDDIRTWLKRIKPDTFLEIATIGALYRPGAMESLPLLAGRNTMPRDILYGRYPSWAMEVLEETSGIVVFQEQLMEIASRVAGFSPLEQRRLAKYAGDGKIKTLVDGEWICWMDRLRPEFISKGMRNGYDKEELEMFWDGIVCSRQCSFLVNKAHFLSYALIAYRCARRKAHDTRAFYRDVYRTCAYEEERRRVVKDAAEHGFVFLDGDCYEVVDDSAKN